MGIHIHKSFIWLISLFLTSCQGHTIYHSYQPVNHTGWHKNDTIVYTFDSLITTKELMLEIGIRHTDSYLYRDIWLTINQDTVHIYLTDSKGHWNGKGIGELRSFIHKLPSNHFNDSIKEIRITHIMTDNPLTGIHDIGIRITNTD